MFANLLLQNFKSIQMSEPIDLKKLSIFCGSNSSGKSSLIQSILMMSQSFSNRFKDEPINLNGHLIRLGSFGDIYSHSARNDEIKVAFSLPIKSFYNGRKQILQYDLTFGSHPKIRKEEDYHPIIIDAKINVATENEDGTILETDKIHIALDKKAIGTEEQYKIIAFESSEKNRISNDYPDYHIIGVRKGELIPSTALLDYDYIKKVSSSIINYLTNTADKKNIKYDVSHIDNELCVLPREFLLFLSRLILASRREVYDSIAIPDSILNNSNDESPSLHSHNDLRIINEIKKNIVDSTFGTDLNKFPRRFMDADFIDLNEWKVFYESIDDKSKKSLVDIISRNRPALQDSWCSAMPSHREKVSIAFRSLFEIDNLVSNYFSRSVKYLGPLRMEPQAIYSSLGHYDPNSVGLKGEFTAAVLHKNKDRHVNYLFPMAGADELMFVHRTRPLRAACQEWLSYLGVIHDFQTNDKGKLGYELSVKLSKNDKWQDLTHVGVGVSQVLPIVLMFLISSKDDVLIFEQPELHLHPLVQSKLCDLFIAMANSERQCIIETHSEYMINRLRLRIAQEESSFIKDNTSLYFINKIEGVSGFQNVHINKYGTVIDWPQDFFDQTDREIENILYEASKKRKREKISLEKNSIRGE
ncbi:DUF3696 domain-containing protein [Enterobacter hormaechei]|uniref:DUF3696 domain-containing protein n=1 Tax=Enterobacter hormaechei TaxID=158836 RepID=UPI0007513548|nr:DUF3696 domain-containing protein [Enterobacter hormaechei]EKK5437039.1 DUF3696 domain-containing protein [Enterobacter hormaechei]KUQ43727.1 hypothetical protein AWI15_05930 [Enterobacter hormaechei subsp. xiangfangensis]MBT1944216.1 DUF3696 domain-containing protein [Enterobacter hormaechei subsp. xiangfangensis]MCE1606829.1 DUF3696 domain-containing protein [Enterobacter hormaechei]MCE1619701.1 DUF3696 domain-containing protein [Enterobacter hormaechei]